MLEERLVAEIYKFLFLTQSLQINTLHNNAGSLHLNVKTVLDFSPLIDYVYSFKKLNNFTIGLRYAL